MLIFKLNNNEMRKPGFNFKLGFKLLLLSLSKTKKSSYKCPHPIILTWYVIKWEPEVRPIKYQPTMAGHGKSLIIYYPCCVRGN